MTLGARRLTLKDAVLADRPSWYSGLSNGSGVMLDLTGRDNHGAVTLAAGKRCQPALNHGGDGSMDFDGADSAVTVADTAVIQNVWDAGGTMLALISARSSGEGGTGRIFDKGSWRVLARDQSAGLFRVRLAYVFSVTTGQWDTDRTLAINNPYLIAVTYSAAAVGNNPTIYVGNLITGVLTTESAASGLLAITVPPVGTRTTDVGNSLMVGNTAAFGATTWDGRMDDVALWNSVLDVSRIQAYVRAAMGIAA